MNYPVWDMAATGGGLIIAVIATIHVYAAHFAVGGGFFLVLTEMKARRENDMGMLNYINSHTRFFLLLTMVFGALTGVGIWLAISAVHPGATSVMIHTFVFGWATEWVCFLVEIVSLFVYYYTFNTMNPRDHVLVGWIYFIAAWLSLFLIDGIISFMLTTGNWPQTKSFWSAFFNPSFIPSLFFRTALALIFAGIYGLFTASRLQNEALREKMVRYCAWWLALPFAALIPAGWWYFVSIPPGAQEMILGGSADIAPFARAFLWLSPVVFIGGLVMAVRLPKPARQGLAVVILAVGLVYMGSFEYIRETSRRPYIIYGHMFSNGILTSELEDVKRQGILKAARWSGIREVTAQNQVAAGKEIFRLACLSCHSVGGVRNNIAVQAAKLDDAKLKKLFAQMGHGNKAFMPPWPGTKAEANALMAYLRKGIPPEARKGI